MPVRWTSDELAKIGSAVRGRNAARFRGVKETHEGRISAGRVEKEAGLRVDRGGASDDG